MDLARLVLEVRPTHGVYDIEQAHKALEAEPTLLAEPVLIHADARVEEAIPNAKAMMDAVGYGSAMLFLHLTEEQVDDIQKRADKTDFREWHGAPGVPPGAHCWIKSFYDGATYSTHRPYLLEAVRRTEGPVLELGCGEGSTPLLHEACGERLLVTVDRDLEWIEKFTPLMSDTHKFEHLIDPAETKWLEEKWDVVFIDHAPGESRGRAIERARDKATYIVVHDSEDLGYGIESLLSTFKYRRDFRRARPWTSVVSEKLEVW